ncbi:MAG: hypothetical protein CSA95_07775 [Bacteroidetes bacterium]|nr:MAG: hypothetical protein CSA95_07775 [Bacteroidota bacterium]PIE88712.1 MAG: hypothetical protein CSA04_00440 [Bacteroidota bacterium]
MRKVLFLITFIPLSLLSCLGQGAEEEFFMALYHLDLPHAGKRLEAIREDDPVKGIMGQLQLLWWEHISRDASLSPLLQHLDSIEELLPEVPIELSLYYHGMRLKIYRSQKQYYRAWKAWKAIEAHEEACIAANDSENAQFLSGIYYCTKGELQRHFTLRLREGASVRKSMEKGLLLLERSSHASNKAIRYQSHYLLMRLYAKHYKNYHQSLAHSTPLIEAFPENYLFRYFHIRYLQETDKKKEASRSLHRGLEALSKSYLHPAQKAFGQELLRQLSAD